VARVFDVDGLPDNGLFVGVKGGLFCEQAVQNLIAFECGRRAGQNAVQAGQATKGSFGLFDQRDGFFGGVGFVKAVKSGYVKLLSCSTGVCRF